MSRKPLTPTWASPDGRVQLYCADCLEVLPHLTGIDAVVTDPPYGHGNNDDDLISRWEQALGRGEAGPPRPIPNDGPEANELYRKALPLIYDALSPGGCCCCCCCGGGGPDPQFARWAMWMDEVFRFKQMVVWDKGPMGMGWHYRRSYEVVLVGEKPGASCKWYGGRCVENIIRPGQYGIRKIIPSLDEHPCAKPIALYAHFIRLHTAPADMVLDPFCGHGPCGIAALRLGRRFVGIEIDPGYFEIAKRRIQWELAQPPLPFEPPAAAQEQARETAGLFPAAVKI